MKKLLIAISLLLVFGITSAAISLGKGSFGSSGSTGASGGGGSVDVLRATGGSRNSSADGGSFAFPQGTGMGGLYMLSGGSGRYLDDASGAYRNDGEGAGAQGGGLSFNGGLQRFGEAGFAGAGAFGRNDDFDAGNRHGYSAQAPTPGFSPLGAASPGYTGGGRAKSFSEAVPATVITTPVPEPETYAMLLAGLAFMGVAVRRRKLR